jgi:hypothetical protein
MSTGVWSLQEVVIRNSFLHGVVSGSDSLVRFIFHHLMYAGWCSWTPLVGFLFVDWGRPVRQLASNSGDDEETAVCRSPMRSMDQLHISDVLLMGFPKIEVSSSIRDSATSFILGLLLHCGRWRSSRLQRQWPATAPQEAPQMNVLLVILIFFRGALVGGWM